MTTRIRTLHITAFNITIIDNKPLIVIKLRMTTHSVMTLIISKYCKMTLSITIVIPTLGIMTLSIALLSLMSIMTLSKLVLCTMSVGIMTLSIVVLDKMTIGIMTLGITTISKRTFSIIS
jgi:hypothetical protein